MKDKPRPLILDYSADSFQNFDTLLFSSEIPSRSKIITRLILDVGIVDRILFPGAREIRLHGLLTNGFILGKKAAGDNYELPVNLMESH